SFGSDKPGTNACINKSTIGPDPLKCHSNSYFCFGGSFLGSFNQAREDNLPSFQLRELIGLATSKGNRIIQKAKQSGLLSQTRRLRKVYRSPNLIHIKVK